MIISNEVPIIETDYSWHWICPECGERQSIEKDGDTFHPVICEKCNTEFPDYTEN